MSARPHDVVREQIKAVRFIRLIRRYWSGRHTIGSSTQWEEKIPSISQSHSSGRDYV